jgi:hypothetical protein
MLLFSLGMMLASGCDRSDSRQSQAVKGSTSTTPRKINVPIRPDGPSPVGLAPISVRWPAFIELDLEKQQVVAGALNLVPAPCDVCQFRTIAHCATAEPAIECGVLDTLFQRAVRMAKQGASVDTVKVAVNYPDFWIDGIGDGLTVQIHLFDDANGRFHAETKRVEEGLQNIFGQAIEWTIHGTEDVSATPWGVRSYPTWFINGHRFRGVQSVNSLARFVSHEVADRS